MHGKDRNRYRIFRLRLANKWTHSPARGPKRMTIEGYRLLWQAKTALSF